MDEKKLREWARQTSVSYEEGLPEVYEKDELAKLFAYLNKPAARMRGRDREFTNEYPRITFEVLLKLGIREQ